MDWVPVSAGSPFTSGEVLVTYTLGHNVYLVDIMIFDKKKNIYTSYTTCKKNMTEYILAWMPLPNPYKNIEEKEV